MKLLSFKEMQLSFRLCHPTHTTPYGFAKQPLPCAYITVSRYVRGRVGQQHRTQKKKKKKNNSPRVREFRLCYSLYCVYPAIVYTAHTHRHGHTFNTITRESPGVITRLDSRLLCPWTKRKKAKPSYIEEIKGLYFWLLDLKKKRKKSQLLAKTDDQTLSAFECRSALWAASFISLLHIVTTPIRTRTSARLL